MRVDLRLPNLPAPGISEALLRGSLAKLKEISDRNLARFEQGSETKQFRNRKEELVQRLKHRTSKGESFEKATAVVGRERLLLSVYLEHFGRANAKNWLPPFDAAIASSLVGDKGKAWHSGRRRQVTLLFFTHFDQLVLRPISPVV